MYFTNLSIESSRTYIYIYLENFVEERSKTHYRDAKGRWYWYFASQATHT